MQYFLYRHIRTDKNEPFYIGIGKKPKYFTSIETEFRRAFDKENRNNYWNNIINVTEYIVDILFESDSETGIKEKEKEFICLYGRKDLGTGILVNLTDGGDGLLNPTKEWRQRQSKMAKQRTGKLNSFYGKKHSDEVNKLNSDYQKGNQIWLGKKHTEESKNKIRIGHLGLPSEKKGKSFIELFGKEQAANIKQKQTLAKIGKPNWKKGLMKTSTGWIPKFNNN